MSLSSSTHPSYNLIMKTIVIGIFILTILVSCTTVPTQTPQTNSTSSLSSTPQGSSIENCQPTPYIVPTLPAKIPGINELDESIGLHVTGSYQVIDPKTYLLKVSGKVNDPLELTYDQIRCLPKVTAKPPLVCLGVFEDDATWSGVPLKTILDLAGVQAGANDLVLVSADGYQVEVSLSDALQQESFLAYEVNGQILPILHGFPVRAVFPDMPGAKWIKWLVEIQVK
jgi:DMSO/TMAO reductase YedYZ molybdopterin-dependent catalytic subunit